VSACLQEFVTRERIFAAQITAIGAFSDVVLMYFDWEKKKYLPIPVHEQVEVASLIGDVAESPSGEPALHIHLVVGKRDGSAMAGHLGEAHVRPTLEVILTESPVHLHKVKDPEEKSSRSSSRGRFASFCRVPDLRDFAFPGSGRALAASHLASVADARSAPACGRPRGRRPAPWFEEHPGAVAMIDRDCSARRQYSTRR
jgi:predicted DNA-binding protein with PD1-like motif